MKIPKGWYKLKQHEVIANTDLRWSECDQEWLHTANEGHNVGDPVSRFIYIRKQKQTNKK